MCPALHTFPAARSHLHTALCLMIAHTVHFNPGLLLYPADIHPNLCASPREKKEKRWDKIFQGAIALSCTEVLIKLLLQQNSNGALL